MSHLPEVWLNLGRTTGLEILQVTQGNIWKLKIKLSRLSSLNTKTKIKYSLMLKDHEEILKDKNAFKDSRKMKKVAMSPVLETTDF